MSRSKRLRSIVQNEDDNGSLQVNRSRQIATANNENKKKEKEAKLKEKQGFLNTIKRYKLSNISRQKLTMKPVSRESKFRFLNQEIAYS